MNENTKIMDSAMKYAKGVAVRASLGDLKRLHMDLFDMVDKCLNDAFAQGYEEACFQNQYGNLQEENQRLEKRITIQEGNILSYQKNIGSMMQEMAVLKYEHEHELNRMQKVNRDYRDRMHFITKTIDSCNQHPIE